MVFFNDPLPVEEHELKEILGPVVNLASRLSTQAEPGQILIAQRVYAAVEHAVGAEPVGELELRGFGRPVVAYEVRALL
jgi:class 3 adenylate cyclase